MRSKRNCFGRIALLPLLLSLVILLGVNGRTTAKYASEQVVGSGQLSVRQPISVINRAWQDKLTFTPSKIVVDSFSNAKCRLPEEITYDHGIDIGAKTVEPEDEGVFADTVKLFQGADGTAYILSRGSNTPIMPKNSMSLFENNMDNPKLAAVTQIDINLIDTSNVLFMGMMFHNCGALTTLDVSGFDTASVMDMSMMFAACRSLQSLDVSRFKTANVVSMAGMFAECDSLQSLDLSGFNTANVMFIDSMFVECRSLTSLDLHSFETISVVNMKLMFDQCTALKRLDISGFDTGNVTDMENMFRSCMRLEEVTLGNAFAFVGANCYLPAPDSNYIPGAGGKWYAASNGIDYAPESIPDNKADTYYAVLPGSVRALTVTTDGNGSIDGTRLESTS